MRHIKDLKNIRDSELIYSDEYFAGIFKKTEGIVSATFFVLAEGKDEEKDIVRRAAKQAALDLLLFVSDTLTKRSYEADKETVRLAAELTKLASLLSVLIASERLHPAYGSMIVEEIRSLVRQVASYRTAGMAAPFDGFGEAPPPRRAPARQVSPFSPSPRADAAAPIKDIFQQKDRKEQIKNVLKEKGVVSIKDISAVITGTSEKSIQRDLNELIASGEVKRHGARRWSTYSLAETAE